jgi:hypothetical protein
MSLINDALKKAARQRAEEQADVAPPMPGGGRWRASGKQEPMRMQTLVLIAAAAVALIVVSAVITGMFVAGKPNPKPAVAANATPETPAAQPRAKVVVQAPVIEVSIPRPNAPAAATALPRPTPTPQPITQPAGPVAASQPAVPAPQSHNELIQGIVDRFHISGVRTAGAESKALVDGHVYKVNDLIDRSLGLRLVKVESDHITFMDAEGGTYTKSF